MDAPSARSMWGWILPARVLLTALAVSGALALCAAPRAGEDVGPRVSLALDPNTAPPEVLGALPRLGPSLVNRIVAARRRGPFRSIDEIGARVQGVGPATLHALRPYLKVAAPRD